MAADWLAETIQTTETVLLYGWPFILLMIIFVMKMIWKRWPVEAIIIEKRGNNLIKTNDRCGKYTDPYTNITGYKLQKSKDTIPVVNYDWVMHNVFVSNTFFERFVALLRGNIGTIFLFRYGSKQYKPIIIKERDKRKLILKQIKAKDGSPILMQVYEQFDPRKGLGSLDFEVIDWDNMNFMVQEQRASIERRKKKGEFMKTILIPLAILIVCALVCIIMIKFSYDYAVGMKGSAPTADQPAAKPNIPGISNVIPGS